MHYYVGTVIRGRTLIIQARREKDNLSCEIYDYFGLRETTKARLHAERYGILAEMKRQRPRVYGKLRYAIVE